MPNKARFDQMHSHGHELSEKQSLKTRAGRELAVEFVANAYQAGNHAVVQGNGRDITEHKRAEDQIRALSANLEHRLAERTARLETTNVELQSTNAELNAFSCSISHDLRAPLRQVIGFVERLRKDAGAPLSKESLGLATTISKVAKDMGNLIDDLLSFSCRGKSAVQKTKVNVGRLVQETVGGFQEASKERNIVWDIQPLPAVRADRALLRMVLVNLISNAVKFTGKQAAPKIAVGCVPSRKKESVIFVRDNGAGFDPLYSDKLFGVFQRLHSHDEFEGVGIGLANVQRIILRHGGRVWAESAVDKGATFYFSIPK